VKLSPHSDGAFTIIGLDQDLALVPILDQDRDHYRLGLDLDQEHFLVILAMTHVLLDRGVVLLHPDLLDLHAEVAGRHPNDTITTAVAILVAIVTATAEPLLLPVTCVENRGHGPIVAVLSTVDPRGLVVSAVTLTTLAVK